MSDEINTFIHEIHKKADVQIESILEEAKKKAEEIIKEAEREAEKIFTHETRSRILLLRRKIVGQAEMEGRSLVIQAKENIVKQIYELSLAKLRQIAAGQDSSYDYSGILYQLLEEAAIEIDEPEIIVEANEKDKEFLSINLRKFEERLMKKLNKPIRISISDKTTNLLGGVIVYNKDQTKIYYNALESRLAKVFEKYRGILGKILFNKILSEM